jgi:UDP-N-acetylglucosamine/UDP-N-acetylgalactosamine diphosphorylase
MPPPSTLFNLLKHHEEEHLLSHWERLSEEGRSRLKSQLMAIDWHEIVACKKLVEDRHAKKSATRHHDFENSSTPICHKLGGQGTASSEALSRGRECLRTAQAGAILMAGGQGTRLGFNGPKGTFPIATISKATLFDVLLGHLHAIKKRFGSRIPIAIMTSAATDTATRTFLTEANFCGLDADQIFFFCQGNLPAVDAATGSLLLDACDRVAVAPDGHGGMFQSLIESGGLDWFRQQDCRTLVSFQVDNPLAKPFDPEFLGHHLLSESSLSTQVIPKLDPEERVGVVAESDGVTRIIEYSDLPQNIAAERLLDGRLRFFAGSIGIHAFETEFLEGLASSQARLPLHIAHKKVPFIDKKGRFVQPSAPNAFKFERFIFDVMPLADSVTVVEVDPAEGFAPLKNPPGAAKDSPEIVRQALNAYAIRHLERVGIMVTPGIDVELDAASIFDDEDLHLIAKSGIFPKNHIDGPLIIRAI